MKHTRLKTILLGVALVLPCAAYAQGGSDFLMDAARGDNAEIMTGKLAQTKSANKGVRAFGATLVSDHGKAKKQVAALSTSMSVTMPADVKPDAQKAYDKLSQLSGAQFDREFIDHMVEDHQKDVAAFEKEANAYDGKVSELAAKQLPVLKKHLSMAQSLQKELTKSSAMQPPQRIP